MSEQIKQSTVWFIRIVMTLLFCVIGVGAGFSTKFWLPAKPVLETHITAPKVVELGNYHNLFTTYHAVNSGNNNDQNNELPTTILTEFNRTLQTDLFNKFLAQQDVIRDWAKFQNQTAEQAAADFARLLSIQTQGNDTKISLTSPFANTELSSKLLTDFLTVAAAQTKDTFYADLIYKWKNLFQQVKSAAENSTISQEKQTAEAKLKIMQSVQPLDNQFTAFSYVKSPMVVENTQYLHFTLIGAIVSLLFGLLFSLLIVRRK